MRLPKGASYKLVSTKGTSLDEVLEGLKGEDFSGYIRLTVEGKDGIEDGYLLLKEGEIIGAEFQSGESFIYSKVALKKIKKAWEEEGIADIYSFTEFQLEITVEENGEALLVKPSMPKKAEPQVKKVKEETKPKEPEKPAPPEPSSTEPMAEETISQPLIKEDEEPIAKEIIEKQMERMELLKKFGLKEPEDDYVDGILSGFTLPSDRELNSHSRELKKEIIKRLKGSSKLEELDLYITPSKLQNMVEFNIEVYVKPLSDEIMEEVESTIEITLKEKLKFPYGKGVSVNAI